MVFSFRAAALPVLAFAGIFACQSTSTTNYPSTALGAGSPTAEGAASRHVNERAFAIDISGGSYQVSLFPKTYGALAGPAFSLIVVSPVLLSDDVLVNSGTSSLVPWFNSRGIAVWLVRVPAQASLEKFGRFVLPQIVAAIRQQSTEAQWVMAGVSLGGQAVAHYLDEAPKNATVTGVSVKAAFFLGTGFDYAYPASFSRRLAAGAGQNICATEFCTRYLPGLKTEFVSARRALTDAAGKPVWREVLDNVSLKDKGVRVMFIAGKIDNVAPSESVYRAFVKAAGDATKNSPDVRFFQPGRMNRLARDFDHPALIASDDAASDVWPEILRWIEL